jgi:lysozyme family protein
MGWFKNFDKIKSSVKQQMRDKIDRIKAEAEKEQIDKGLSAEEYYEAKNNGTLDTLPSVDTSNTNSSEKTSNTALYIAIAAVGVVGIYLYLNKKKKK